MIRIGIRHNLFYPGILILSNFFRRLDSIIIKDAIDFKKTTSILTVIMFFSEFISGLIFFKINNNFLFNIWKKNKEYEYMKYMKIKLIKDDPNKTLRPDSLFKIYFLLFLIAFYDFLEFEIKTYYLLKYDEISESLILRLRNIVTISSSLLCYYLFKFPLYRHQKFSLLIIFISLILIIFLEFLENFEKDKAYFMFHIIITIIIEHFFNSFKDVIEKYILEYDNVNAFQALMIEGLFGSIITCIFFYKDNPFNELKDFLKEKKNKKLKIVGLIICLILYFLLSGGKNIYRVITNTLYSPITKGSADSILDPFLIIYYVNDFKNKFHFFFNLILTSIMDFWIFIYNELLVLFCCKMEHETYIVVSMRAKMNEILNEDNSDISDDDI